MAARACKAAVFDLCSAVSKCQSRSFSAVSSQYCLRRDSAPQQIPSVVRGASLQSLPGHRLLKQSFSLPNLIQEREKSTHLVDTKTSLQLGIAGIEEVEDFTPVSDEELQKNVTEKINTNLETGEAGRLFAVVQVRGKQFKVSAEDLIVIKYDFPPNVGDRIRLEKVLAVGGKDFTLFGQPLLSRDAVRVEATVVEKTLTNNRVWFVYRRKTAGFKKFHLYREALTMLVINSVQVAKLPQESSSTTESSDNQSS